MEVAGASSAETRLWPPSWEISSRAEGALATNIGNSKSIPSYSNSWNCSAIQVKSKLLQFLDKALPPQLGEHRRRQGGAVGGVGPEGPVALDQADQPLRGQGRGEGGADAERQRAPQLR